MLATHTVLNRRRRNSGASERYTLPGLYSSRWTLFQLPGINSDHLAQRAQRTLELMAKRGISLPPGNRLARAVSLTHYVNEKLDGGRKLTDQEPVFLAKVAEAWRTMWEAFLVMHAVTQRRSSSKSITDDLLESFLSGTDLPTDDKNPHARNIQFEAYTGAVLVSSGLTVTRAEPDFRIQYFAESTGVAVKRLTSLKESKVYDELRDAARQLRDQNLRGFVSLSLDNFVTDLGEDSADAEAVGQTFNEQIAAAHRQLDKLSGRETLLGAFLTVNWSRWITTEGRPYLQWSAPFQTLTFTENPDEIERAKDFFTPMRQRWHSSLDEAASLLR